MDDTQSGSSQDVSWLTARLGHAIDVFVDRNAYQSLQINDPSQAYGVDEYGNVYQRGQLNKGAVTARPGISPMIIGLGLVALVLYVTLEQKKG